jgi:GNAT superfamily N-acetyltransferase
MSELDTPIEIRAATSADAAALAAMRYEFRGTRAGVSETRAEFLERCTAWMSARLLEGTAWHCWVACMDGGIVGHIWLQLIEKIPNPAEAEAEHHGYITNFFVREHLRGAGIGSQLLERALAWCRSNDVDSIILWPTTASVPLYVRHEFDIPKRLLERPAHLPG